MIHSIKSFAGQSSGWDITPQAGKKLQVFDQVLWYHYIALLVLQTGFPQTLQILWS